MILNVITFVACFAMLFLFRRLDKSNVKLTKLRRYSKKVFNDYKKLSDEEKRKYKDATIEMDILIKKSNAVAVNLRDSIGVIENKLKGLEIEKSNLSKVEDDIKVISHAAREVNKQIEFIAIVKEEFSSLTDKISNINDDLSISKKESATLLNSFEDKLRLRSREISEEFGLQVDNLRENLLKQEEMLSQELEKNILTKNEQLLGTIRNEIDDLTLRFDNINSFEDRMSSLSGTIDNLEETVFRDIKGKSDNLKTEISDSFTKFNEERGVLLEQLNSDISKVYSKLSDVENNVNESKSKLVNSFATEVDKVRTEIDNLTLSAVSKKDEIVQAARREAEDIREKIDDFEEKYHSLEEKLVNTSNERLEEINSEIVIYEGKFKKLSENANLVELDVTEKIQSQEEKIKKEFALMEQRLSDIKKEIQDYEESNKIFSRTDMLIKHVDDSIYQLNDILEKSESDAKNLEQFLDDFESFKEIRKEVERELRSYQGKKDKFNDIESNIKSLLELHDLALLKSSDLDPKLKYIDSVENKINLLATTYDELDLKIEELREYEDMISKSIQSVQASEMIIKSIDGKIRSVQKITDNSDKKLEKVSKHLQEVEANTLILKSRENEIELVKDKFDELEGLSELMQSRISQVTAMFNKVEGLKNDIVNTDERLKNLFSKTDKKMREFADFIKAVDTNNPIVKQVNSNVTPGKNVNEHVIKTVRDLSDKGWEAEDIAKKLLLDENSVRFIINTSSI